MKNYDYIKGLTEFERLCFPEDFWSERAVREALERSDIVYGVDFAEDGRPIGYFLGAASFEEAELYRIGVLPEFRGQGHSKHIMEAFLDSLPKKTERVFLEVRESNLPAVGLYNRYGFKVISLRRNYYGNENGLVFRLDVLK
ncbi:MAG: ribosomal protein S18-alanine N-acetyltransferase [Firmicutes bacterium]|nr:ribosomal protein S18-alanine N-acetyltransferase [[Eubacterium] siraeum]MCM1487142.1 ribosomal protein S18-alanine N-acetyltransferase [Bacillota bacterium]